MLKIACLMMQRDEEALLEPWIRFHSNLFGLENLYIWDNGSQNEKVLEVLARYESSGLNVEYANNTPLDFRRKGVLLGNKIKALDAEGKHDFYLPLDCDEFFSIQTGENFFSVDKEAIYKGFEPFLGEEHALSVGRAFYNVLGYKGHYKIFSYKKTIFHKETFKQMDHGFHEGISKKFIEAVPTKFAYIHYHFKPHSLLIEHSRNKVAPYFNVEDPEELKKLYKTNRLVKFMLDDEETYMKEFNLNQAIHVPDFEVNLRSLGTDIPF